MIKESTFLFSQTVNCMQSFKYIREVCTVGIHLSFAFMKWCNANVFWDILLQYTKATFVKEPPLIHIISEGQQTHIGLLH